MSKWDLISYEDWKQIFLADVDAQPHTTAKGDKFVSKVLQIYYNLSESDAIDATDCAGANDHGLDALHIFPQDEDYGLSALVVQGKYGTAGRGLQVYTAAEKFFSALKHATEGNSITVAVDKIAGVLKRGGVIQYVISTVEPLKSAQQRGLENIKKIAYADFGDKLVVEAINLQDVYAALGTKNPDVVLDLPCHVVQVRDAFVGLAKLTDMYEMMRNYAKQTGGTVDRIYDHNLRKYIKESSKNNSINLSCPRLDGIVPFTMEGVWQKRECRHLFIGHLASGGVGIGVDLALHRQACLSRGRSDQLQDHRVALARLTAPVLADPGKEAMLNLIPFARSRRQVADRERETRLVSQLLQFPFPQAHTGAVTPSSIGTDEQPLRLRILLLSDPIPPASDALHREGGRIMVHPHIDPTCILSQVVHPVGSRSPKAADGEVVDAHLLRLLLWTPFAPRILEIAHQFFLFRIHRDDRLPGCKKALCLGIDILELGIAIWMVSSLTRLAVSL